MAGIMVTAAITGAGAGVAVGQDVAKPGLGPPIEIHGNLRSDIWPQLQNTPQRTGYSPAKVKLPLEPKWSVRLTDLDIDNKTSGTIQAVIAEGKVYAGCKNGRFFALDARTGEVKWQYDAGGPIWHTAGYSKGKVFFAALDGRVYALESATGEKLWVFDNGRRHGFSTAVLLVGEKVLAVDRGGRLFCLNQSDGSEVWHYDAGAPVSQSPAYNDGRIYFADEHMRVHAVGEADGSGLWRSKQLAGLSFQYYWPVVVHGMVIVRSLADDTMWCHYPKYKPGESDDPWRQSLFLLDEETGRELPPVEHYMIGVHQGTTPPPSVTRDGLLVARWSGAILPPPNKHAAMGGWSKVSPEAAHIWVLQDLRKGGKVAAVLEPDYVPGATNPIIEVGLGPPDETTLTSVFSDLVISMLGPWGWRQFSADGKGLQLSPYSRAHGVHSLTEERWLWKGIQGAGGWFNQFAGGGAAVSGVDGMFYNVSRNHVQCHGSVE